MLKATQKKKESMLIEKLPLVVKGLVLGEHNLIVLDDIVIEIEIWKLS